MASTSDEKRYPVPMSCFIALKVHTKKPLYIGNTNLAAGKSDPRTVMSLNIVRSATSSTKDKKDTISKKQLNDSLLYDKAEFTITTVNAPKLLDQILKYMGSSYSDKDSVYGKVTFKYGFVNGLKSYSYPGMITGLSLSQDMYTLTLTVSSKGFSSKYDSLLKKTKTTISDKKKKNKYNQYSDVVTDIAKSQGWIIGKITPTKKIKKVKAFNKSIVAPTVKSSPIDYINKHIAKKCVSSKKEGSYKSVFRFNKKGQICYYFVPTTFIHGGYKASKDYNFVFNMLPDGNVLSWKPELVDGTAVASTLYPKKKKGKRSKKMKNVFSVITSDSKHPISYSYSISQTKSKKKKKDSINKLVGVTNETIHINASASEIANYAEAIIRNNFEKYCFTISQGAKATIEILGDPYLQVLDRINVIPMYPVSPGSSSNVMHPSGGTYRIDKISESISDQYITTLSLTKENNTLKLSDLKAVKGIDKKKKKKSKPKAFKVKDTVTFKGGKYYTTSSKGSKSSAAKEGKAVITSINAKAAYPYHIKHTKSSNSKVYGWVNKDSISK